MEAPRNDEQFEQFMEEIDSRLRADGVPMSHRSLAGLSVVCKELRISLPGWTDKRPARPGVFTGMDLAIRIADWFDQRYGERAAWDPRPGRTVVIIRSDPWEVQLPRFFGSFRLFASSTEDSDPIDPIVKPGAPLPRYNVIESVSKLAPGLRRALSRSELDEVLEVFRVALDGYHLMEGLKVPLATEAYGDVDTAVAEIMRGKDRFGASKWASLQAAEKMLKAYLISKGRKPRMKHDLSELAGEAEKCGLGRVPRLLLQQAQASASVRYREVSVKLNEAVVAHHSAMDICAHVASYMTQKAPSSLTH